MSTMQATIDETVSLFREQFGDHDDVHVGWSPGRINLIGEYTDLNNGYVLPMAIDLGICIVLRHRVQPGITAYAAAYDETAKCSLLTAEYDPLPSWLKYIAGAAVLSQEKGCRISGFNVVVHGNLPIGGGVSSSAALTTAAALAMHSAVDWPQETLETAQLCQAVEHRFAGVMCGIMDQMACRMGKAGSAIFIDCESHESQTVPIRLDHAEILVVDSGVPRSLHATKYNERRSECALAVKAIQELGFATETLRRVDTKMLDVVSARLDPILLKRVRHVVTENGRVLAAQRVLELGELSIFGGLMFESHESLRTDFEVSIDELDFIVSTARACDGVMGARLTGAGFGGNAIVLMAPDSGDNVRDVIRSEFTERFGRSPTTHRIGTSNEAQSYKLS